MQERIFVLDAIRSNRRRIILGVLVFILVILLELTAITFIAQIGKPFNWMRFLYSALLVCGIALLLVPALYFIAFQASRKAIIRWYGLVKILPEETVRLDNAFEGVCIGAGIERPEIAVIDMSGINAISLVRGCKKDLVLVTGQAVRELSDAELEALLAHEAWHIASGDTRLWLFAFALTSLLPFVLTGFLRFRSAVMEHEKDGEIKSMEDFLLEPFDKDDMLALTIFFFITYVALAIIWAPLLVSFYLLVLPRDREYLADAQAVMLTRNPEAVSSLLKKAGKKRSRRLRHGGVYINHMFFNHQMTRVVGTSGIVDGLFDIHPPENQRIVRVTAMS